MFTIPDAVSTVGFELEAVRAYIRDQKAADQMRSVTDEVCE
jgi:hypothetical protein